MPTETWAGRCTGIKWNSDFLIFYIVGEGQVYSFCLLRKMPLICLRIQRLFLFDRIFYL